ncbi:DUF1579 domain-containing protein [uncultured Friedmanniella sp.]|uniref:DUF1579 domain-containing protein n=1 Tax=uncultured Friedmanniella sp. TaxID=335381 RepID=UPI0035CA32CF
MDLRTTFLPLLGSWTGLERQEASPWAPAAGTRASIVFRLDVAGTVVVQDYRQVREDGVELTAHGVLQGVPNALTVRWWLFDSYGQPPVAADGGWADGALVLEKTTATGSARHRFRPTADRLDYEIEVRPGGAADWSPFLSGRYRRVSGH